MNASSTGRRRGSQPTSKDTEVATLTEQGIESMLRPAWIEYDEVLPLRTPCPSWCRWRETGHRLSQYGDPTRHESLPLRIRQDRGDVKEVHGDDEPELVPGRAEGFGFTHLEVRLIRAQQMPENRFSIEFAERFYSETSGARLRRRTMVPLLDYEVSELLAVLQHFASLGTTS